MAIQYSFRRYEKKFLLTPEQFSRILPQIREQLTGDRYPEYTICNIYYDTDTYDLIRQSLQRPPYKEKFRLRSYGVPGEDGRVFGEIKKKFDHIVYKRRVAAAPGEMERFLGGGELSHEDPQIQREIHWFLRSNPIAPKVFLAYDRLAFVGKDDPELRVTFDRNIRWRDRDLDLRAGDRGEPVLEEELVVMEAKLPGAAPLWLARLLSEENAFPASFSKYGTCYQRHLARKVFPCARPLADPRQVLIQSLGTSSIKPMTERMVLSC